MIKPHLRVIGDVHGKISKYIPIAQEAEYSLQIGDMGFNYTLLSNIDYTRYQFFPGNHDNYDDIVGVDHAIGGNYGEYSLGEIPFFFIRGAFSIDWRQRVIYEAAGHGKSWWSNEELTFTQMNAALAAYKMSRPRLMITHDCPHSVAKVVGKRGALKAYGYEPDTFTTNTQELLQACFDYHQPEVWLFAHFHQKWVKKFGNTLFVCINELDSVDISKNGELVYNMGSTENPGEIICQIKELYNPTQKEK